MFSLRTSRTPTRWVIGVGAAFSVAAAVAVGYNTLRDASAGTGDAELATATTPTTQPSDMQPSGDVPAIPGRGSDTQATNPPTTAGHLDAPIPAAEPTTPATIVEDALASTTTVAAPVPIPTSAAPPQADPTTDLVPLEPAAPPPIDGTRVAVPADIGDYFASGDSLGAGLAVMRASGPLPRVVVAHPNYLTHLAQALGSYVPSTADLADAVAGAYERTLIDIIDEEAADDTGLCVVTGVLGDGVRCAQVGPLWTTPSVNLMRAVALAAVDSTLVEPNANAVRTLIDTNFSGGNAWALLRGANAAFLASELRIGWARQGVQLRSSDAEVAGHLLFLAVYADESRSTGGAQWSAVTEPSIQAAYGTVWNQGRATLWSDDRELVDVVWTDRVDAVLEVSLGTANPTAPY